MPRLRQAGISVVCTLVCVVADAATSKLHPPQKDEAASLRLAQVMHVASRAEILELGPQLEHAFAAGLKDSDLTDGRMAIGRVHCCNESTEVGTSMIFFVPPELDLEVGDIVVVRMGRKPSRKDAGEINVATELREKADAPDSRCVWDPPDENLWMRILYCDWMPAEGWTLKKGLYKTWLKRPSQTDAQPRKEVD